MALEEGLVTYLTAQTPVTALVQSRIYPLGGVPSRSVNRQGQSVRVTTARLPYVVYETASERPEYSSDGMAGLVESRVTLHCFAEGYKATKTLKDAIIGEMSGFAGVWGSVDIESCYQQDATDNYAAPTEGHAGRHRVSLDFTVIHVKAAPSFA